MCRFFDPFLYKFCLTKNTDLTRPQNAEELFNLRHASARNVVERTFGVMKKRFKLLTSAPEYGFKVQVQLVHAACFLHNFILCHDPDDASLYQLEEVNRTPRTNTNYEAQEESNIVEEENSEASAKRDRIAEEMWQQYTTFLARMGENALV